MKGLVVAVGDEKRIREGTYDDCKTAYAELERLFGEEGAKQKLEAFVDKIRDLAKAVVSKDMLNAIDQLVDLGATFVDNSEVYGGILLHSGYPVGFPKDLDKFVSYCSEGGEICAMLMEKKVDSTCSCMACHGIAWHSLIAPAVVRHCKALHAFSDCTSSSDSLFAVSLRSCAMA